jgi:hypothetical protein
VADRLDPLERLEADIDARMHDLAMLAADHPAWDYPDVLVYLRAAYSNGYCDALREADRGERDKLLRDHGYLNSP